MGKLGAPRFCGNRVRGLGRLGGIARIAVLAAALALAPAGCGGDDDAGAGDGESSGPTTITVGTLPIANAAPMYMGMEKGFFEEENLKIEPQVGEGGAALIPSRTSRTASTWRPRATSRRTATSSTISRAR